jgi:hypothetical protein
LTQQTPILNRYYDLEYFSGSQCSAYIGDVWVDDMSFIQWQRTQEKTPLYGYASQLFDDTAAGHVIVNGAFSINFKESGYVWAILRRYFSLDTDFSTVTGAPEILRKAQSSALTAGKLGSDYGIGGRPVIGSNGTRVSRATIERLLQGKASRKERYDFYHDLAGYATFSPGTGKDKVFEDIVEIFEDQIWKTADNTKLLEQIRRVDDNVFDGFDIYVLFGNYANPKVNHTCVKIVGVRLIGEGMSVGADGEPLQMVYNFLARTTV